MTIFDEMSSRIIKEQELVIGPLAWEEARKVSGFRIVDEQSGEVAFDGDPKEALNNLVSRYSRLFGQASVEVCKNAVQDLLVELPNDQMPEILQ